MIANEKVVYAVDLDRTLLDTDRAFGLLVAVCGEEANIDTDKLRGEEERVKASAGSFDVMGYLRKQGVDDKGMAKIYTAFSNSGAAEELLYQDARPFLDTIMGSCVVLTTGGREWQQAKIQAVGFDQVPHIVTPIKEKGALIRSWNGNSGYQFETDNAGTFEAGTISLVDDKAVSFKGLPEDCAGYWLVRGAVLLDSQNGDVPQNVQIVSSLNEINR